MSRASSTSRSGRSSPRDTRLTSGRCRDRRRSSVDTHPVGSVPIRVAQELGAEDSRWLRHAPGTSFCNSPDACGVQKLDCVRRGVFVSGRRRFASPRWSAAADGLVVRVCGVRRILGLLVLRGRCERSKDLELIVLRPSWWTHPRIRQRRRVTQQVSAPHRPLLQLIAHRHLRMRRRSHALGRVPIQSADFRGLSAAREKSVD
jgi:hypothetical protein